MRVMTVDTGHSMGQNLLVHGNRQACLLVAFAADLIAVHFQQEGIFRSMGQVTGKTVTHRHRTMHIGITKMTTKILVTDKTKLPCRPD